MADVYVTGGPEVLKQIERAARESVESLHLGLKRAALHLIARAKALAPEDTTSLAQSIHSSGVVTAGAGVLRVEVGAHAMSGDENYGIDIHENQEYDGPNVGGSRTIGLGPDTEAKGQSTVEPTDGKAGGKFMSRPIFNKPEVYAEIIARTVKEKLDGPA